MPSGNASANDPARVAPFTASAPAADQLVPSPHQPPAPVPGQAGAAPEQGNSPPRNRLVRGLRGWRKKATDLERLPGPNMPTPAPAPSAAPLGTSLRNLWPKLRHGLLQNSLLSDSMQPSAAATGDGAQPDAVDQSRIDAMRSDASVWNPSLDHWHDVPSATPNSSIQSLAWLSAAAPSAEIQRVIATALGDRVIGPQVTDRLSDMFLNSGSLSEKDRLLWLRLRESVTLSVTSQSADLRTVTRCVILKWNMNSITLPDKDWLSARFRDALYDDTVPSLDYVYAACWASNWVQVDLGKLRAHSRRVYVDLRTASLLWTLAQPSPGNLERPSYDALLIMAASFGWHRGPSNAVQPISFIDGMLECISCDLRNAFKKYAGALPPSYRSISREVELMTFLIINHAQDAIPEALNVLFDCLGASSGRYVCLLDLLDEEQYPRAARVVWGIFEDSPTKALGIMNSLPLDAANWTNALATQGLRLDIIRVVTRFLSLDWPQNSQAESDTTTRYLRHLRSQSADPLAVARLLFEFPALLRPEHRPIDCGWVILADIATHLAQVLSTEDNDPLPSDLVVLVRLFSQLVTETGILGQTPPVVPFSKELQAFISVLDDLRESCGKYEEISGAFSSYPPRISYEKWTTIRPGEITLLRSARAITGERSEILRGTFRNSLVAINRYYKADNQ